MLSPCCGTYQEHVRSALCDAENLSVGPLELSLSALDARIERREVELGVYVAFRKVLTRRLKEKHPELISSKNIDFSHSLPSFICARGGRKGKLKEGREG